VRTVLLLHCYNLSFHIIIIIIMPYYLIIFRATVKYTLMNRSDSCSAKKEPENVWHVLHQNAAEWSMVM